MASCDASMLRLELNRAFTPHRPVSLPEALRGRLRLVDRLMDAVHTEGLHIVLYGDRGTGKTSLARVLAYLVQEPDDPGGVRCVFVSCSTDDSFTSMWRKVGREVLLTERPLGFARFDVPRSVHSLDLDDAIIGPSDVLIFLQSLGRDVVIIFDEFDRLVDDGVRTLMADTIKFFSDHMVSSKLFLVGVGQSLSDLLHEHLSISRNIAQIPVGPMPVSELSEIVSRGYEGVGLGFDPGLDEEVARLSQGYPHYAHLLGLWAGRRVADSGGRVVTYQDLYGAIPDAIMNTGGGWESSMSGRLIPPTHRPCSRRCSWLVLWPTRTLSAGFPCGLFGNL